MQKAKLVLFYHFIHGNLICDPGDGGYSNRKSRYKQHLRIGVVFPYTYHFNFRRGWVSKTYLKMDGKIVDLYKEIE
jgi:hypothetical protein